MKVGIILLNIFIFGSLVLLANSKILLNQALDKELFDTEIQTKLLKSYTTFQDIDYKVNSDLVKRNMQLSYQIEDNVLSVISKLEELKSKDALHFSNSRGIKEINLFKNVSPSIVLILTKHSIGSGAIIAPNGDIITNNHVVGNNKQVVVALKPKSGSSPKRKDLLVADVLKVNQSSDLALIKLQKKPKKLHPIRLGKINSYEIGQDVHAIGHPEGNLWTYTKGFISQIRDDYNWVNSNGFKHHAKVVIQTQTPINPGNSGGPLFDDKGKLIGVNSFKKTGGEGLNYAISVEDVLSFLKQEGNVYAQRYETLEQKLSKKWKVNVLKITKMDYFKKGQKNDVMIVYDRDFNNVADALAIDLQTNGNIEIFIYDKDEDGKPELLTVDTTKSGKPNIYLYDTTKDGKYDTRGFDNNEDGKIDKFEKIQ
jgi:S1-C subfamily serine protease